MNPLSWLSGAVWVKVVGAAALLFALLGYGHYQYLKGARHTEARYKLAISDLKLEAARQLTTATDKVLATERKFTDLRNQQEIKDVESKKTVEALGVSLRINAGPAGRLRDPNAAGCGRSGAGPGSTPASAVSPGANDPGEAGGLFSAEASRLLLELAQEADEINLAYASCRSSARIEVTP